MPFVSRALNGRSNPYGVTVVSYSTPWGTGTGEVEKVLREFQRLGVAPAMFGLEYSHDWLDSMPEVARSVDFFNTISLELAPSR